MLPEHDPLKQDIYHWIDEVGQDQKDLLMVLQKIQSRYQCISEDAMKIVAEAFHIQPAEIFGLVSFFPTLRMQPTGKYHFRICRDVCCDQKSSKKDLITYLQKQLGIKIGETTPDGLFSLEYSHCMGMCDQGPVLAVNQQIFTNVDQQMIEKIINHCQQARGNPILLPESLSPAIWDGKSEIDSFSPIEPGQALQTIIQNSAVEMHMALTNHQVVPENLLARLRSSESKVFTSRVLVCNTDLPIPGSFKERILLADHFDLLLEGMLIGAYLAGADREVLYLRQEFENLLPVLASYLEKLKQLFAAKDASLIPTYFINNFEIRMSPGFIAGGTENILLSALNSNRFKENSSSALYMIPVDVEQILKIGSFFAHRKDTYKEPVATRNSTQIFAVSGECENPGLFEMPAGTKIIDLLQAAGADGAAAVHIGGIQGTCFPAAKFDHVITEADLNGNTTVIVYGPKTNFREIATNIMEYTSLESCGQCAPCREGSIRILECFRKIQKGSRFSVIELYSIAECMQQTSRCEFGQTTSRGIQSLLQRLPELV
jgi:[NiFe] hydrogenase diaphorase moiety large subunit